MKKKTTTLLVALLVGATSAFAQSAPRIGLADRYGHGEDSVKCLQNISLYSEHVKTKNYAEAYQPWKEVFYKHPVARFSMYSDGAIILRELIKVEKDAAKRTELVNELLGIHDQHIKYLESVNAFRKNKLTESKILADKAHDYFTYTKPLDAMKAHKMALEVINMDTENAGHQIMLDLMRISSSIAKQKESFKEQVISDYLLTSDLAAKNLAEAQKNAAAGVANADKLANMWEQVKGNIDAYLVNSGAADCENLQAIYAPQVEANKENLDYLRQVITVMTKLGCKEQEACMTAAEYAHNIEPTAGSAAGCASRYLKRGENDKAVEFMEQAIELETDEIKKAEYAYTTAQILYTMKQFSKAKGYANKAISLNGNYGAPYILIAQMYAASPKWSDEPAMNKCTYFAAIDKLVRAKNVDPSVAEEANRLIGTYSAYTPKKEDLFFIGLKEGQSVPIGGWINETTTIR